MLPLVIILFPSEIAVMKTEAHTKRIELEHQGNARAGFHESWHIWVKSNLFLKNDLSLPDFGILIVTWQQSVPESEKWRWGNNGFKSTNRVMGLQMATGFFPAPWFLHSFVHLSVFKETILVPQRLQTSSLWAFCTPAAALHLTTT